MTSPNLMGLVRELKGLNAKKKAGQPLTDDEKKRRKELKTYLKTALEEQKGGAPKAEATNPGTAVGSGVGSSEVDASMLSESGKVPASPPAAPAAAAPAAAPPSSEASGSGPAAPAPAPAKKPGVAARNAFAIDAGNLFDEAASSEVVSATVQMESGPGAGGKSAGQGGRPLDEGGGSTIKFSGGFDLDQPLAGFEHKKASKADIDASVALADKAIKANKARPRAAKPEEVVVQLEEIREQSGYTDVANEDNFLLDDYYGGYFDDGYDFIEDERAAPLDPIDPREIELHKVGLGASTTGGVESGELDVSVPLGLAFLDDFAALYTSGVLPSPQDEEEPDLDDPNLLIPGRRKVTVHMLNGASRRGVIRRMSREDLGFTLEPMGTGQAEEISITQVKAVFIQRPTRAEPLPAEGQRLTVTFRDRRKIQGASVDFQPGKPMFTLIPPKGQFERIIVNGAAVHAVQ